MARLTKLLFRRDTATNWSSTNPTLDSGEPGFDTTNKVLKIGNGSSSWSALPVLAQQGSASAARPLLTDGAYLNGTTGLVLTGLASNYASAPDSAALSITGDIDMRMKLAMTDWTPSEIKLVFSKWTTTGNQRSYYLGVNTDGKLRLSWATDGTSPGQISADSTAATGFTDGDMKWIRATMDVNDGAGNRVVKFYTSNDGTTWTQLGTTVTTVGTTSIYDGTAVLEIGSAILGSSNIAVGTVARAIILNGYDGAGSTVFDADFSTQTADTLAFTESSSNAATVTINTTRYTYGLPGVQWATVTTLGLSANRDFYHPFYVTQPITVDMARVESTTGPASNSIMYFSVYAADDNFQPTGNPLINNTISIDSGATGLFSKQFTAVTLQPGAYVVATNLSVTLTARSVRAGFTTLVPAFGTSPFVTQLYRDRTAAAFPNSPNPYNNTWPSGAGFYHFLMLRWKVA